MPVTAVHNEIPSREREAITRLVRLMALNREVGMDILVLPGEGTELDNSIEVGQSLAGLTDGRWRILRALGWRRRLLSGSRSRTEYASEAIRYAADPDAPLSDHRVVRRSLVAAVPRELARASADLVVMSADRVLERRNGGSFDELVEAIGRPVLATRGEPTIPPATVSIVTERRDLEYDVLRTALGWLQRLRASAADGPPPVPLQIDMVHGIRAVFDWAEARTALAAQLQHSLDRPDATFRSLRPELMANLPRAVCRLNSDLTIAFMDRRGSLGFPRLGKLARAIVNQNAGPVLLLPPQRIGQGAAAGAPERA